MLLDDLRNEIQAYAANFVTVDILNFTLGSGGGSVWNPGDTGTFQVRVRNRGHMDIKKLSLHLNGLGVGQISMVFPVDYKKSLVTRGMDIDAHQTRTTVFLYKAVEATQGDQKILEVHVQGFDLTMDHILLDHTGHTAAASDTFSTTIHPS